MCDLYYKLTQYHVHEQPRSEGEASCTSNKSQGLITNIIKDALTFILYQMQLIKMTWYEMIQVGHGAVMITLLMYLSWAYNSRQIPLMWYAKVSWQNCKHIASYAQKKRWS